MADILDDILKKEIMLQCNERMYIAGMIGREMYEQAKTKIVSMKPKK